MYSQSHTAHSTDHIHLICRCTFIYTPKFPHHAILILMHISKHFNPCIQMTHSGSHSTKLQKSVFAFQVYELFMQVVDCLCKEFEIDHRMTSAYHPQSNGLCERMNQTIIRYLMLFPLIPIATVLNRLFINRSLEKCVNDCLDEWDQSIESVLFAIRTSPQSSTKFSPYEVANGEKSYFPNRACYEVRAHSSSR